MNEIKIQDTGSIQDTPLGTIDSARRKENSIYHANETLSMAHTLGLKSPSEKEFDEVFKPEEEELTAEENALFLGIRRGIKEYEENPFTGKTRIVEEVFAKLFNNKYEVKLPTAYGNQLINEYAEAEDKIKNWEKAALKENSSNTSTPTEEVDEERAKLVWDRIEGVVKEGISKKVGVNEKEGDTEVDDRAKAVMNILRKHILNTEYNLEIGNRESTIKAIRGAIISGDSEVTRQALEDTLDYLSISILDFFPVAKDEIIHIKSTEEMTEKYKETKKNLFDKVEILMSISKHGLPSNREDLYPAISGEEFRDIANELVIDFIGKDYQLDLASAYESIAKKSLRIAGRRTEDADIEIFKRNRVRTFLTQFIKAGFFGNHNEDENRKAAREAYPYLI